MCNKAVHGAKVSKEEAKEIIMLTERLNRSFPVGYSINFEANKDYAQQEFVCEWEHCIERFPLEEEDKGKELSCHVFGHDCPGGLEARKLCDRNINDIPQNRFIKNI